MPTRWGILGCGSIAHYFVAGLKALPEATLQAVGSRSQEKADAFGEKHGAPNRHGSYEALAQDPEVDVIYVATPHPMHAADMILCLEGGKAVLCEKPFTINARQAESVITLARQKGLFLMEGHWSRFFPAMARLRELVREGAIGEPRLLQADFGFRADWDPSNRLFDPALGGGALLDVGCYCMSLSSMIFGTPTQVTGLAHLGETQVDEQAAMCLLHARGELSALSTAVRTNTPQEATLVGTEGTVRLPHPWWAPKSLILAGQTQVEEIALPFEGNGFNYEATCVMDCLREGKTECDVMPLDETLAIMRSMDTLRAQWGLAYPNE
jgi:dihydrodiol dehydrogenase / D-xylose 1-dehydrogenase (NADP)